LDEWFWYYQSRCNPPHNPATFSSLQPVPWTALSLGTYLIGLNRAQVHETETSRATDTVTGDFHPVGDPPGFGVQATYLFGPWNNSFRIGPFGSFDVLHQTVNQNFAGGQFLGTTTHWLATAGVKLGSVVTPDVFVYGLAGTSLLSQNLNVNFATAATSSVNTPGFTLGFGGEWHPPSWRVGGSLVTLFAQYQHTWWNTANFNAPASSSTFNYAFRREDDTLKFGVNFYFGAPPAPASPAYPVKAPALK
jgi:hypothetical protein